MLQGFRMSHGFSLYFWDHGTMMTSFATLNDEITCCLFIGKSLKLLQKCARLWKTISRIFRFISNSSHKSDLCRKSNELLSNLTDISILKNSFRCWNCVYWWRQILEESTIFWRRQVIKGHSLSLIINIKRWSDVVVIETPCDLPHKLSSLHDKKR